METTSTSDAPLQNYSVYVQGDNIPLARAEIESLVHVIDSSADIQWQNRFGRIICDKNPIPFLGGRAVLLRESGRILASAEAVSILESQLEDTMFDYADLSDIRFAIKVQDIGSVLESGEKSILASVIGAKIRKLTKWSVSLKQPDYVLTLFVGKDSAHLSETYSSGLYKSLEQIGRKNRPFFHPSMMNTILARIMCNIATIMPSHTLLDPFCGGGGILVESAKIGLRVIGIDTNWHLLSGARRNLLTVSHSNFSLIQADSKNLPLSDIDYIVTDPPYGRTSSTRGTETKRLVSKFLGYIANWKSSPIICICSDAKMNLESLFQDLGGCVQYQIQIPVHRSLTREIFRVTF